MELRTGHLMKELRSDRGKEFINKDMTDLLAKHGIKHNLSAPYTPQQNGVAERANRTVLEAARSMLAAKGVPVTLWGEAVATAAKLRNMMPGKEADKTPHE